MQDAGEWECADILSLQAGDNPPEDVRQAVTADRFHRSFANGSIGRYGQASWK